MRSRFHAADGFRALRVDGFIHGALQARIDRALCTQKGLRQNVDILKNQVRRRHSVQLPGIASEGAARQNCVF